LGSSDPKHIFTGFCQSGELLWKSRELNVTLDTTVVSWEFVVNVLTFSERVSKLLPLLEWENLSTGGSSKSFNIRGRRSCNSLESSYLFVNSLLLLLINGCNLGALRDDGDLLLDAIVDDVDLLSGVESTVSIGLCPLGSKTTGGFRGESGLLILLENKISFSLGFLLRSHILFERRLLSSLSLERIVSSSFCSK
jgi:hypothetical protein